MEVKYYQGNPTFSFEGRGSVISIWEMRLSKGEQVTPHAHADAAEYYVIVEGFGEMTVGEDKNTVLEGDVVFIPPGAAHTVKNEMDRDLRVLGFIVDQGAAQSLEGDEGEEWDLPDEMDAAEAILSIKNLLEFKENIERQIREAGDAIPDAGRQIAGLRRAIMASVGKIWQRYKAPEP